MHREAPLSQTLRSRVVPQKKVLKSAVKKVKACNQVQFNEIFSTILKMQFVGIETGNLVKVLVPFLNSEKGTTKNRGLNISDNKKVKAC